MKTAISLPDHIFVKAELLAKKRKTSRSQLYAEAIAEFVARYSGDDITEAMNQVCDDEDAQDPGLERFVAQASREVLKQTEW